MKKFILAFLTSTLFSALPPLAQSTRELQALLSDQRLYSSLGSAEQIKEVIKVEDGYLVLTQNYVMKVDLKYGIGDRKKTIGPIHFEFEFQQPVSLRN